MNIELTDLNSLSFLSIWITQMVRNCS